MALSNPTQPPALSSCLVAASRESAGRHFRAFPNPLTPSKKWTFTTPHYNPIRTHYRRTLASSDSNRMLRGAYETSLRPQIQIPKQSPKLSIPSSQMPSPKPHMKTALLCATYVAHSAAYRCQTPIVATPTEANHRHSRQNGSLRASVRHPFSLIALPVMQTLTSYAQVPLAEDPKFYT
jgi:hypothetical protein